MDNHIKIVLGTINKKINKAKLTGNMCMLELYLMDIINDYLTNCNSICLSKLQIAKLYTIYSTLMNKTDYICKIRESAKYNSYKPNNININNYFNEMATFNININSQQNLPPSEVGDGSVTTAHATTVVFTRNDFTSNTTPPYEDPEGDAAELLKVITLPSNGLLKLNGANVTANQIIDFSDIDSGLLSYQPDPNTTTARVEGFTFAIADSGSLTFTS